MNMWPKFQIRSAHGAHHLILAIILAVIPGFSADAQNFTSGSDGSDGAYNPLADETVLMSDKADGIWNFSSVNIPADVTVTFEPNAANTPVTWLVQTTVVIDGTVSLDGGNAASTLAGAGGPAAFRGGVGSMAAPGGQDPGPGSGPGGGNVTAGMGWSGGNGSYGEQGASGNSVHPAGATYGNKFLLPLIGGSGGSGGTSEDAAIGGGGGGGGGAILIAADQSITVTGLLSAEGGDGTGGVPQDGGGGSGGAIRLVAPLIQGTGTVSALGGNNFAFGTNATSREGGRGRVRLDGTVVDFTAGTVLGINSQGSPTILMLPANIRPSLDITTVAGIAVTTPTPGVFDPLNPDVTIPSMTPSPVDVVVAGANIPVPTLITVTMRPNLGAVVTGSIANTGTLGSSTATVSIDLQPGDGTLHATAFVTTAKTATASLRETGLAPNGETFVRVEMETALGGETRLAYVTASGARFLFPTGD